MHALRFADGRTLALGERTRVMGILNLTPDSFSDGGRLASRDAALRYAERMAAEGADLIDVGGESTRPGAAPVDADEESRRTIPLIEELSRRLDVPLSIDTRKAAVARRALDAGAGMVNDVAALDDPQMAPLVAERGCPVVLMHMRGEPATMQRDTRYEDVVAEVRSFLDERAKIARNAGVSGDKIVLDPGIGFGKSARGNRALLRELPALARCGKPVLVGASRKNFIGEMLGGAPVDERLEGSLGVAAYAALRGAHIVRVHDVAATVRTLKVIDALRRDEQAG